MSVVTRRGVVIALVAAAVSIGCGGDEPDGAQSSAESAAASGAASTATSAASDSRSSADAQQSAGRAAPVVESVQLMPDDPVAGEMLMATVRLGAGDDEAQIGYVWKVGGRKVSGGESHIVLPDDARKGETVSVDVRAASDAGTSAAERATVSVGNRPPEWESLTLSHFGAVPSGTQIEARPVVVDPDLDEIVYEITWVLNGEYVATGPGFDTAELDRGDKLHAVVEASDGDADVEERSTDGIEIANAWPAIVSAPGEIGEDGILFYQVEVADPDGDRRFRFELVSGPPDMTLDRFAGELRWQATREHVGQYTVEILVKDMHGGEARQRFDLTVGETGGEADESTAPAAPAEN